MARPPGAAAGRSARLPLRGDPPLNQGGPEPPFAVDPARLYEVDRRGHAHTDAGTRPEWLGDRHLRILGLVAGAAGLVGLLAGLSVACLALGAQFWAAIFALATVAATPLVMLGPLQDWWRYRRGRRRCHGRRPPDFPRG